MYFVRVEMEDENYCVFFLIFKDDKKISICEELKIISSIHFACLYIVMAVRKSITIFYRFMLYFMSI